MKELIWIGNSLRRLREFPDVARQIAGRQLRHIQEGKEPVDWRAMSSIGAGVKEIRIHRPNEYRVIYVSQFPEAIFILHAFEKKTQQTAKHDIQVARLGYAEIETRRKELQRQANEK